MNAEQMLIREELHKKRVEYAEEKIKQLLSRVSSRDALIELTGSLDVAELLIDEADGDPLQALQIKVFRMAEEELPG